jgi:hypothetical protein
MGGARIVAAGLVAVVGAAGCVGAGLVAARAATDMRCPEKEIKVTEREMGGYEASGCGKRMSYMVRAGEVLPDEGESAGE